MASIELGEQRGPLKRFRILTTGTDDDFVKYEPWMDYAAARIAELEADAKRLDWLERTRANLSHSDVGSSEDGEEEHVWTISGPPNGDGGSTPREAIDAAMAVEGE